MPDASVDGVLSDVPYGLGPRQPTRGELVAYLQGEELDTGGDFMGKRWSVPSVRVWTEIARVLKPGGHVLAFGGARTGDLVALGIRAGGFDIRDCITWNYFSAMPKSLDVAKAIDKLAGLWRVRAIGGGAVSENVALSGSNYGRTDKGEPITDEAIRWDGWGSGLKPTQEPIYLARKPFDGTLVANAQAFGTGALNIDGTRIAYASDGDKAAAAAAAQRLCLDQNANRSTYGRFENGPASLAPYLAKQDRGRWPTNAIFDEGAAEALDALAGDRPGMSGGGSHRADYGGGMFGGIDSTDTARGDDGGPSRFHYVVKPTREERELGCRHLPLRRPSEAVGREEGTVGIQSGRAGAGRSSGIRNHGPCLKPVLLTRYLATLILPPPHRDDTPRRILVPYCGTGSEMIGALLAGWDDVVGIERDEQYLSACRARVGLAATNPRAFEPFANRTAERVDERQVGLFATGTDGER
jgi:site-specific DNA-methyltransferase (adenine-specific)